MVLGPGLTQLQGEPGLCPGSLMIATQGRGDKAKCPECGTWVDTLTRDMKVVGHRDPRTMGALGLAVGEWPPELQRRYSTVWLMEDLLTRLQRADVVPGLSRPTTVELWQAFEDVLRAWYPSVRVSDT